MANKRRICISFQTAGKIHCRRVGAIADDDIELFGVGRKSGPNEFVHQRLQQGTVPTGVAAAIDDQRLFLLGQEAVELAVDPPIRAKALKFLQLG